MIAFNNCQGQDNFGSDYSVRYSTYAANKNSIKVGRPAVIVDRIGDDEFVKTVIKITKLGRATQEHDDPTKRLCVTIDGDVHTKESMTRAELIEDKLTAKLFNKNGHFKRQSVCN